MSKVILALDQGTTSSRAAVIDQEGQILALAQKNLSMIHPRPGWVEQDPSEIWATQIGVAGEALQLTGQHASQIEAIGLANQRETTILWERETGQPVMNAIGWQCRRTAALCEQCKADGWEGYIQQQTGLLVDAYFSASKIAWIFQQDPKLHDRAKRGELCFGNVDSWLIWKLTSGQVHVTDHTNASRTMLYNLHTLDWDQALLDYWQIPEAILPKVIPSTGWWTMASPEHFGGVSVPVAGIAGDQQAALFGQACDEPGMAKITYGTGGFLLMNTGTEAVFPGRGLLTTIAWGDPTKVSYALEGSIFTAGAVVKWLRDEMNLIREANETETLAWSVSDNGGVYFVPAFTGLGAPYWNMYARGALMGITRNTRRSHVVRAALESIAYQTRDVLVLMEEASGIPLRFLRVDGGASVNQFLLQFQADILNRQVERPLSHETTTLGAAYLAGLTTGFWKNKVEIQSLWHRDRVYQPGMEASTRNRLIQGWNKAVERALDWAEA